MKPYPCCRHVHSAIDAALEIRDASEFASRSGAHAFGAVRVGSYPAALGVTDRQSVASPHDARFSMQYAVASTLLRGAPGLETFEPDAVGDVEVQALMARVSVDVRPDLADAYPRRWGAVVEVETADGSKHQATRPSAVGDPDAPLGDDALDAKVRGLMTWAGLPPREIDGLLEACRGLVGDGPVFELLARG